MTIRNTFIWRNNPYFIGVILYGVSSYMVRYYDKKINKHKFEILRPKPKGKKRYLIMNIRGCAIVKCANY